MYRQSLELVENEVQALSDDNHLGQYQASHIHNHIIKVAITKGATHIFETECGAGKRFDMRY
jgi:hypothetical protein